MKVLIVGSLSGDLGQAAQDQGGGDQTAQLGQNNLTAIEGLRGTLSQIAEAR